MNKLIKIILLSLAVLASSANSRGVKATKLCNKEIKKEKPKKWRLDQYCVQAGEHYQGKYGKRNYPLASRYYLMGHQNDKNINEIQPYAARSSSLRSIGHSYVVTGDFHGAEKLYRKYLKSVCIIFADEEIQGDYKTLANVYPRKKENLKKGLALWNKIYAQILEANQLSKEGMDFYQNDDYSSAIDFFQKSLLIKKEVFGTEHHNIVESNNDLAMTYEAMGNHSKALEYKQKALKIRQKIIAQEYSLVALIKALDTLALKNPTKKSDTDLGDSIASSYSYLQNIYRNMGAYPEALESQQKASVIQKRILGKSYSPSAGNYNNLGLLYRDMGKYPQALEFHQKALNINEKNFGKESIQTARNNSYLGTLYYLMKNYPKALEHYQKALTSREKFLGEKNTETAKSYSDLANLYCAMKNYPESLKHYKKALLINEKLLGVTHIETAKNYNNLSILYRSIEDYKKSQEYYQKALFAINTQQKSVAEKICDEEVKKKHPKQKRVQTYCTKAGEYYQSIKDNDSASWYYLLGGKYNKNINEMQATIKKGSTYRIIGYSYVMKGEFKKAKELYSKFLKNASILVLDDKMQKDYKLLSRLYPKKKKNLKKGLNLWNKIYEPLKKVDSLYAQYRKGRRMGPSPQARKYLFKIIELQKKYQNENNIFIFDNIYLMGTLYTNIIAFTFREKDLDLIQQVEKAYQAHPDRIEESGRLFSDIASTYKNLKQIDKSIDYYKKAIYVREKIIEKNSATTIRSSLRSNYNNLSQLHEKRSKYASALKYAKKELALKEKLIEFSHSDDTEIYMRLGLLYSEIGNYPKALMYYQKVLAIQETLLETKYGSSRSKEIKIANVYSRIASLYLALYDYSKALQYQQKALNINKKYYGLDRDEDIFNPRPSYGFGINKTATSYNNIAVTYSSMGDDSKALEYFLKAYNIEEKIRVRLGSAMYINLGSAYQSKKEYSKAMDFYQKALVDLENTHIRPLDTEASLYSHLGSLYKKMKDYPEALKYYQKSLTIRKKIFGNEHPSTGSSYSHIGWLYLTMKNYPEAYRYAKLSFEIFLKNRDKVFTILDSKQKTQYLKETTKYISLFLRSSYGYTCQLNKANKIINSQTILHSGANAWLNYKGSIFDSENAIAMLYASSKDKKLKAKIDDLVSSKRYLAKLYQSLPKPKERDVWKESIKNTEEKIAKLTNEISSKASSFKEQQGLKSITYRDITSYLNDNELYIDYAKIGGYYYLFTLNNKENITFNRIDQHSTKKIDSLVKAFREDINTILNDTKISDEKIKTLTKSSKDKLSQLYNLLIKKPLAKQIKSKTSLIISPDGALRLLPFEALYNKEKDKNSTVNNSQNIFLNFFKTFNNKDKKEGTYLIEEKEIRYIPSGKELVRLYRYSKDKISKAKESAVIFANPNFNTKIASASKEQKAITPNTNRSGIIKSLFRMRFTPLPGTEAEAKEIKEILGKGVKKYDKNKATESELMKTKEPNILHIATHGFFINDDAIPNPMLKSGIALAGANTSVIKGKSDGVVTALKLSGLDLKGTDLVVLSACQTGVVDINATDSVSGLSKAFIQAGAKDIVMSLWSVDDQATKELMTSFYQEMKKKKNYAKALKAAKLKMIEDGKHPFYWGAFVVSGL